MPGWLRAPAFWCDRDAEGRRVTWIELFFDLVFVAAVAQVGTPLVRNYDVHALGRYAFLLTLIWWAWNGYAVYATRFDSDDGLQRALTLAQMVSVIFMAANAEDDLTSISSAGFAAAYAVMRLVLVVQYLRALMLPQARRLAAESAAGFGAAAAIWLISSLTPWPVRAILWGAAIVIELITAVLAARHTERLPPDGSHLPERFGLFTLILLGESIVAVMKGVQAQAEWSVAAASSALLGMTFVFALWWWYFDGARAAGERAFRGRGSARRLAIWTYAHLPLYVGLALAGVGVQSIVTSGAAIPLSAEAAWMLCGSAASVMVALTVLGRTLDGMLPMHPARWAVAICPLLIAPAHGAAPAALIVTILAAIAVTGSVLAVRSAVVQPRDAGTA